MSFDAESAYLFRHALWRDAAYSLQLPSFRAALHLLAADLIEQLHSPPHAESPEAVAREIVDHLAAARCAGIETSALRGREHRFARMAAQYTEREHAVPDALCLAEHAASLSEGAEHAKDLRLVGRLAAVAGRLGRAREALEIALKHTEDAKGGAMAALELHKLLIQGGELERAGQLLELAGRTMKETQDPVLTAHYLREEINAAPDNEQAIPLVMRLKEFSIARADDSLYAKSLSLLASRYRFMGRLADAEAAGLEATTVFRRLNDHESMRVTSQNLANLYSDLGRYTEAEAIYVENIRVNGTRGDIRATALSLNGYANVLKATGRLDAARHHYEKALALVRESGMHDLEGTILGAFANFWQETGQAEHSVELNLRALAVLRGRNQRVFESITLGNLGNAYVSLRRYAEAEISMNTALNVARAAGYLRGQCLIQSSLGRLVGLLGRSGEGESLLRAAVEAARQSGNLHLANQATADLATCVAIQGRTAEAQGLWDEAVAAAPSELSQAEKDMREACAKAGVPPLRTTPARGGG